MSSKYRCVKSLNVYISVQMVENGISDVPDFNYFFFSLGLNSTCQGDLLAPYKNSLALGKRTGALLHPDW